jgi:hypothetical protein
MAFDRQDDEDEREDAEDEGLDRVEHELEREQGDGTKTIVSEVMTPSATSPP